MAAAEQLKRPGITMKLWARMSWMAAILPWLLSSATPAQTTAANTAQQLVFAGLRTSGAHGQLNAVASDAAGDLYLLYDQKDGVRVFKVSNDGATVLAQVQLGARGDTGVAMALDPSGAVYVAGTSTSGALTSTSGAAFPVSEPNSTNSFVARFNANLDEQFLTFCGSGRIAASALATSGDAVFVTGIIYGSDLPVTPNGIEQEPAFGSTQNGFVEAFSADGATLVYATYLSGAQGDTTPTGIAADAGDDAWVVGSTTASGFPTVSAIVPNMLSNPSGFLLRLTPAGDGIVFSTFVPGPGLSAIVLDSAGEALLLSGAVALGQFPVDTVTSVLVPTTYQTLLRMPLDGSSVQSGTVIAPGLQSTVTAAGAGAAWVGGQFTAGSAPLLPKPALAPIGTGYAVRVTPQSGVDETIRFGGIADQQQAFASLPVQVNGLAVDAAGELIAGGSVQPTASANLLATETYELPLRNTPTAALPSTVQDAEMPASSCGGSLCAGSAAYLAKVELATSGAALTLSASEVPFFTLRNLGSAAASGLQVSTSSGTLTSNCGPALMPGGACEGLLSGGSAGNLTASSANAATETMAFSAYPATPPASTVVFDPKELDFGVQASSSAAGTRTITVTNLGSTAHTFASGIQTGTESTTPYTQASSDCALDPTGSMKMLAAGATCHIVVGFTASSNSADDGFATGNWTIADRQLLLTGYGQAVGLSVSSGEIDFGTQFRGGVALPRYLYLSNASDAPVAHTAVSLPANSPFTVADGCPATLPAGSVCRLRLDYDSSVAPSTDSVTLALDQGLTVLVTGSTVPPATVGGSSVNPNLSLSTTSATFGDAVVVTGVSSVTQTVGVTNTGSTDFPLTIALTGDFSDTTSCGAVLSAGASCAVAIQFTPSQPGARQGLLSVTAGAGTAPATAALSGSATPILANNNGILSFPPVSVGQPLSQFYKVTQPFDSLTVSVTGPYRVTLVEDVGFGHGDPPSSSYVTSGSGTCHNCWVGIRFQPASVGAEPGTLTFSSDPHGLPYQLELTGEGVAISGLVLTPSAQDFGSVPVHSQSGAIVLTLTNLASAATAIKLAPATATGDFTVNPPQGAGSCGASLVYQASCYLSVSFAPTMTGARNGALTVTSSAGNLTAALSGTGGNDPGIALSPLSLTFANVGGSASTQQAVTVTNTGTATVQVGTISTGSASFSLESTCGSLAAAASCSVQVTFRPGSGQLQAQLSIPVTSSQSGSNAQTTTYSVALNGTYTTTNAGLTIVPASVDYGPEATLTQGSIRQFSVDNLTSRNYSLTVTLPHDYALVGSPCTAAPANGSCTFNVQFVPLTNGDLPGTVTVQAVPGDGSAALSSVAYADGFGVGTGALTITGGLLVNGEYNFGQIAVGQTATQAFTLANQGAQGTPPITVRRVTSAPPFPSTTNCGSALAVGQSCTVTVIYSPTSGGGTSATATDHGQLIVESDAQSGPDVIDLDGQEGGSGTGAAAALTTLALSQGSLTFAPVTVGDASPAQAVTLTNTGNATIQVASVSATPDFAVRSGCSTLNAGSSCTVTVTSTPQSAGVHLASLSIDSDATSSLEFVSLISVGAASSLSFAPQSLSFGSVLVGSTATLPVVVTNTGAMPVVFTSVTATGDYSAASNCPSAGGSLAPQTSCTVQVTFAPTSAGPLAGSLLFNTSASTSPLTVPLTGTGTQSQLTVTPSSLAFGSLVVGESSNLSVTLANHGTAAVTGLALNISGDYALTVPCPSTTLAVGATCTAQVTFTPTQVGARNGSLIIKSSDPSSPITVPLTGTGIAKGNFTLTVDGGPSASVTVKSGGFATYALAVTSSGGFASSVALTCTPVQAAAYASCSLLPSTVNLANGSADSTATINTIDVGTASASRTDPRLGSETRIFMGLLLPGLLLLYRRGRSLRRSAGQGLALAAILGALILSGCGGRSSQVHYTPPGSYQFEVTASSTSGVQISQTVTMNLVVQPR